MLLKSRNIRPISGNLDDLRTLTDAAREADAVVQAAFKLGADVDSLVKAERAAVLGDTGSIVYAEDTPIPPHPFRGRLETEQKVLNEQSVHGIVVRPPNVYGRGNGKAMLSLLQAVGSGLGAVPYAKGTADHLWSFVHVEDLADLFGTVRLTDAVNRKGG
jgi:nucleoside-diphosphate-sugar epimerase